MDQAEIRSLAKVYRDGLPYAPPQNPSERLDFDASEVMGHYRRSLDRMMKLASRLSSKNEQGHEVPNPAATTKDLAEYAEAVRECQEARDALRADWVKRKVERIFGVIDIRNLRPLVEESRTLLFPSYFAKRGELR